MTPMASRSKAQRGHSWFWGMSGVGAVLLFAVFITLTVYRPDAPLPLIPRGSSAGPSFAVQIIRPRSGLPLSGLLPPALFGVDAELGFDSVSNQASYTLGDRILILAGDEWVLHLALDEQNRLTPESHVEFNLVFEERVRRVRCWPGNPVAGTWEIGEIAPQEFSGFFVVELPRCEDAASGQPLGWPPQPFVLRGSFDRLGLGKANGAATAAVSLQDGRVESETSGSKKPQTGSR